MKSYLSPNIFLNSLMTNRTDANATCSKSSSVVVKLVTLNIEWILSPFYEKTIKSERILLLTAIKCNFSFLSIDELSKIMPVTLYHSKLAKNIKLSEAKTCYLTKFSLALYKCGGVNKFWYFKYHIFINNQSNFFL